MTHPQAVYTSRLLDFKNLPEPKNADNKIIEYSWIKSNTVGQKHQAQTDKNIKHRWIKT
ncbi:hypothetical protein GLOIN_2v1792409 [Rhizophagus irregularis DAOM 181602=DAOM 197198]|uniref:Uncharacterized protein n=1 Tax=Rhizophagus irregularis (strain DAOM 181602 / DAOM 197198 / MUCL 43194) TaxID=747089 RepID=A0A2P4NJY0_RHIID|nr:hypothetical protein GLOIN_2v1792409 [Rhizophagus irregularis DAOM 181602=DAOM 197198]POG53445.1 hypothetical protein GLOIN_2v1792409 [Rhizophagus irregularis DAOM 181602=DAOM 197198]|eukprot:XP_025164052.1 hypothetical protein GLOIN_2v1792409 [Rhizophagus irregularis DAOM 181602=DAOM 197198]